MDIFDDILGLPADNTERNIKSGHSRTPGLGLTLGLEADPGRVPGRVSASDLGLDPVENNVMTETGAPSLPGRALEPSPVSFGSPVGEITLEAVAELSEQDWFESENVAWSVGGNGAPLDLQRLQSTHHELARLVALGYKGVEISRVTGFTEAHLSRLKSAPFFGELVQKLSEQRDLGAVDVLARVKQAGLLAVDEITSRLETKPESIPMKELRQVATSMVDRAGYSPVQRSEAVSATLSVTAAELAAIKRGDLNSQGPQKEPVDVTPPETPTHQDPEPAGGGAEIIDLHPVSPGADLGSPTGRGTLHGGESPEGDEGPGEEV